MTWLLSIIIILVKLFNPPKFFAFPLANELVELYLNNGYVTEVTRKLFSFLFSSLPPIKVFSNIKKAIVTNFASLARHEPGDQRRKALKRKSEHQNPTGPPPQTHLDAVPGEGKQLHIHQQPTSLTSKKLSRTCKEVGWTLYTSEAQMMGKDEEQRGFLLLSNWN